MFTFSKTFAISKVHSFLKKTPKLSLFFKGKVKTHPQSLCTQMTLYDPVHHIPASHPEHVAAVISSLMPAQAF